MKSKEQKIRERDDRLLKNERSWRRTRIGVIFLAAFFIFLLIFMLKEPLLCQGENRQSFTSIIAFTSFWLLMVSWLNSQLEHIDSIKLYRKEEHKDN